MEIQNTQINKSYLHVCACVSVLYLKLPRGEALWGQKARVEGAVDLTDDVRLYVGLNLRH